MSKIATMDTFLSRCSTLTWCVVSTVLIAIVALADYLTGPLVSFSIFYVAPVALTSWYSHRLIAVTTCLAAAATWFSVDIISIGYDNALIPAWNALVRLGFFAITAALLIALRTALQQQRSLAEIDELTRILNRRAFESRCEYLFRVAERHNRKICVCYMDIDDFKRANDEFGHQTGDAILKEVAALLSRRIRQSDVVGRLGGDEFAFALPETDHAGALQVLDALMHQLRAMAASNDWPVGFSIGVAACHPPLPTFEEALRHADTLMYAVKRKTGGGFLVENCVAPVSGD